MISFSIPDVFILLVLAVFVIRSCVRGFVREMFSLLSLGIAVFAAARYGAPASLYVSEWVGGAGWMDKVVVPLLFAAVWLVLTSVFRAALRFMSTDSPGLSSRIGGGLLGCAKGVFVVGLLLAGFETSAPDYPLGGGSDRILPYMREVSARIRTLGEVEVAEKLDSAREKIKDASEGAGALKDRVKDSVGASGAEEKPPER